MIADHPLGRAQARLREETTAEVRFDPGSRMLYSTDASLYQIEPVGVVVPRSRNDAIRAVQIAAEEGIPILPRGSATSLSGQTVGAAIILDFSKYLNRIGVVDRSRGVVKVEPGVVLDRLNDHLRPLGLMFGPDVSTSDRATLGGMIGNNSAGARSLRYGKTIDHVESVDVVLGDGTAATFGPVTPAELDSLCRREDRIGVVYRTVRDTVELHRDEIAARYPHILRRVSGYNLDEFVPGLPVRPVGWPESPFEFNLARMIVGSEGTLGVVTGATVKVVPRPAVQGLVVLSFGTIPAALERLAEILEFEPVSVEMLDRTILDLAARNAEMVRHLTFTAGRPEAVLAAQFYADDAAELTERAEQLVRRFDGSPGVLGVRSSIADAAKDSFWKIRKAGLSLLMGMVGDAKPVAFVEDTAVSTDRLPAFYDRFRQIVARHGAEAACYGHADVGCLHIRPILNVKTPGGVDTVRAIGEEISDLVAEFGGAMSGEHGDGLARSRWNRKLFGPKLYEAFLEIKQAFDPDNRLNPGKVVAEPDLGADLRLGPGYEVHEPATTAFDYSAQGGFARAVEMCSGVGACRKTSGGTMCPSYMVTRDEEHSTRGRANLLRMVLSGQLPAEGLANESLHEALDLCLQCKACKTECPSNVDMAKLKAEVLYQVFRNGRTPLGHLLMGNVHRLNAIGSAFAPIANWSARLKPVKMLLELVLGIDHRRTLPTFRRDHFRRWFQRHKPAADAGRRGEVVFLDDCFTTYNNPEVGQASVTLLEAAGYRVRLAGLGCCGRAAISKGLLDLARDLARENVARLAPFARAGVPILGAEPSCLLTLVDEYRDFRLGPDAAAVASSARLVDGFLGSAESCPDLEFEPLDSPVLLHGHCQQRALVGTTGTVAALRRVPGVHVTEVDSGCCGMAGSFGYEHKHYDVSVALANRVLLPAIAARPDAVVVAPGFSCRSQIHGLAGHDGLHPVELLARQLRVPAELRRASPEPHAVSSA